MCFKVHQPTDVHGQENPDLTDSKRKNIITSSATQTFQPLIQRQFKAKLKHNDYCLVTWL